MMNKFIPSFSFKGTVTKPRSLSSSFSVERCASGRLITTRSSLPFNPQRSARLRRRVNCMGDRGTMGHPPTWESRRDPVRSLPRPRRVLVRGLELSAERRPADLNDRWKASVAAERVATARSNQQATSFAELTARFQLSPYASDS